MPNCTSRALTSSSCKGGLSAFTTGSSKVGIGPEAPAATWASCQCPWCSGLNEPDNNNAGRGPDDVSRPSMSTSTACRSPRTSAASKSSSSFPSTSIASPGSSSAVPNRFARTRAAGSATSPCPPPLPPARANELPWSRSATRFRSVRNGTRRRESDAGRVWADPTAGWPCRPGRPSAVPAQPACPLQGTPGQRLARAHGTE